MAAVFLGFTFTLLSSNVRQNKSLLQGCRDTHEILSSSRGEENRRKKKEMVSSLCTVKRGSTEISASEENLSLLGRHSNFSPQDLECSLRGGGGDGVREKAENF
jgi:hypothetical protein